MKDYTYYTMFIDSASDEPKSFDWGHKVIKTCVENNIPYNTTYDEDGASECTIWVKKGYIRKLNKLIKK